MTNDLEELFDQKQIRRERLVIGSFLALFGAIGFYAVYQDWLEDVSAGHIVLDLTINILALLGAAYLFMRLAKSKQRSIHNMRVEFSAAKRSADLFKAQVEKYREGITEAITQQLRAWNLTPAEEEVCLFLLKGFSLQEIADLRKTSERTIRQQASILYRKSGLSGRAQLSAFFVEDLLVAHG